MKKTTLFLSSTFTALALPVLAFAQNSSYINYWISNIKVWLGQAVVLLMIAMTIWFLISVFRYISEKDPGKLADKRTVMVNSLIGLFVSVSVWGIIAILGNILGTNRTGPTLGSPTNCPPGFTNVGGRCL